jgi:hypothetical protein
VRGLSGLTSGKSETICATRRCTVDESVSDTVRLYPAESFVDLDVLVSKHIDMPLQALDGPIAEA